MDYEAQKKVLQEASRWFRSLLRRAEVDAYEEPLFKAVAEWRLKGERLPGEGLDLEPVQLPRPPKVPLDLELMTSVTQKDIPAFSEDGAEGHSTQPIPPDDLDVLLKVMKEEP